MILKSADDKSKRLLLLQDLQRSSVLDSTQKKWLRDELMRVKKGIQGERESAYYLELASSANGRWLVTFDNPGENGPKGHLQVWDAAKGKFDSKKANALIKPTYHNGFDFPKV